MEKLSTRPACNFVAQAPKGEVHCIASDDLNCAVAWTTDRKNEDRHSVRLIEVCKRELPFYAIFDGHAGPQVAEQLSQLFAKTLADKLETLDDEGIDKAFKACCLELDNSQSDANPTGGGSTAICALQVDKRLHIACVGDSVAQLCLGQETVFLSSGADVCDSELRRFAFAHEAWGGTRERFFVTQHGGCNDPRGTDFTWHRQVTWWLDGSAASIATQEKRDYQYEVQKGWAAYKVRGKGEGTLAMARSIGDALFQVPADPTVSHVDIHEGSKLILASDGFYDVCSPQEAAKALNDAEGFLQDCAEWLVGGAVANESRDDVTVLLVNFKV